MKKENEEKRKERRERRGLGEGGTEQERRREGTVGHIGRRRLKESETVRQEERRIHGQKDRWEDRKINDKIRRVLTVEFVMCMVIIFVSFFF